MKRQTIRRKIFHLVLSGVFLFSLGAVALLPQPVSASPGEEALSFDGDDDYVNLGQPSGLDFGSGDFTIEMWFKSNTNCFLYDSGSGGAGYAYILMAYDTDIWMTLRIDDGTQMAQITTSLSPYTDGEWHYLVFERDGNFIRAYVDGSQHGSDVDCSSVGSVTSGRDTWLGACSYPGYSANFQGIMDEVRISSIARTPAEITDNWNGGVGERFVADEYTIALWHMDEGSGDTIGDETINDNDGTIYGATWAAGKTFPAVAHEGPVELWRAGSWEEDYGAIQQAIDAAQVFDTIIVHGGTYNEHLFIDKTLTFKSIDGEVIIDGQSLASGPSWRPESDISIYPVVWIDACNVVFGVDDGSYGGFTVKNAAPWEEIYEGEELTGYSVGIAVLIFSYECVVENNIITNTYNSRSWENSRSIST